MSFYIHWKAACGAIQGGGLELFGTCEHGVWRREGDRKASVGLMVAQLFNLLD